MFAQPRPKKRTVERPFYRKKRKHQIEEISFDPDARHEYLTGFRKRKLQRVKHAQEVAVKKAREARNEMRKKLRDDRKRQYEEHVRTVSQLLRESEAGGRDEDQIIEAEEGWGGIGDGAVPGGFEDQEQEYIDDDRFTTVTIESVAVTRDGMEKPSLEEEDDEEEGGGDDGGDKGLCGRQGEGRGTARPQDRQARKPPNKPKKFRYESKHERKAKVEKQRSLKKGRQKS